MLTDCTSTTKRQADTSLEDLVVTTGSVDADVVDTDWTQQCQNEYYAICGTSVTGMSSQILLHD